MKNILIYTFIIIKLYKNLKLKKMIHNRQVIENVNISISATNIF